MTNAAMNGLWETILTRIFAYGFPYDIFCYSRSIFLCEDCGWFVHNGWCGTGANGPDVKRLVISFSCGVSGKFHIKMAWPRLNTRESNVECKMRARGRKCPCVTQCACECYCVYEKKIDDCTLLSRHHRFAVHWRGANMCVCRCVHNMHCTVCAFDICNIVVCQHNYNAARSILIWSAVPTRQCS